jgi:glutamine cyclotransferase
VPVFVFMEKVYVVAVLVIVAVLLAGVVGVVLLNPGGVKLYTYSIVKTYPHDPTAFTEGLVFDNGVLYESTGNYGASSMRRVDLESGDVLQEVLLSNQYFGEGLAVVNDSLVQLTLLENVGFIYDKATFGLLGNFSYSTQGWGLTYDGSRLIMSDGSSNLYFLDAVTFQKVGQVSVHDGNTSVNSINELEYVNGDVYANIWLQQKIAIINPQTGQVKGWIDLSGIYQSSGPNAVLNGIAYDSQTDRFFVTGKDWPNLYQIQITPQN